MTQKGGGVDGGGVFIYLSFAKQSSFRLPSNPPAPLWPLYMSPLADLIKVVLNAAEGLR